MSPTLDLTELNIELDELEKADDETGVDVVENAPVAPDEPATPAEDTTTEPVKTQAPTPKILTLEEINAVLDEKLKGLTPAEKTEVKTENKRLFEEGYQPKDPEEYAQRLLDIAKKEVYDDIKNKAAKEEADRIAVQKGFDDEYAGLVKAGKVPDTNTDEGLKIKDSILALGKKYHSPNFTVAQELWSKIPVEEGGGYVPKAQAEDAGKARIEQQKKIASRTRSKGGEAPTVKGKKYSAEKWDSLSVREFVDDLTR